MDNVKISLSGVHSYTPIEQGSIEYQYARSLNRVLETGTLCENRTGIDTIAVNHQTFIIENCEEYFPILRGKKVFPLMPLKEMLWMLHGRTDVEWLKERGVTYWDEWAGEDGTIGKSYGYQYRNFNGIDQVKWLFNEMEKNPMSRRLIISLWNVNEISEMNLPPCVHEYNFSCTPIERKNPYVEEGYDVSMHVHVRSNDAFLGAPYDFMQVTWLLSIVCFYMSCKTRLYYRPKNIYYIADNYHIYTNHLDQVKQYLANVRENKENVITNYTRLNYLRTRCNKDVDLTDIDKFFDAYEFYATKEKSIALKRYKETEFYYPQIKADVAV